METNKGKDKQIYQRWQAHRERKRGKSKVHNSKHVKRRERTKLKMKTDGALKRHKRHPWAEVRSGLILYAKRHGSLPCWPVGNNTVSNYRPGVFFLCCATSEVVSQHRGITEPPQRERRQRMRASVKPNYCYLLVILDKESEL